MHVDPLALDWRPHPRVTWDVLLGPRDLRRAMELDVRQGLTHRPRELPPKYFYDARGSRLFDAITRLPEYYPTRREREILTARAPEIAARTTADTLVELGSGTSDKTRLLLGALSAGGHAPTLRPVRRRRGDPAGLDVADRRRVPGARRARGGGRLRAPRAAAPQGRATADRLPRRNDRQPRAAATRSLPRRHRRAARAGRRVPARNGSGQGHPAARGGVQRQPGRDRRVQPQRALGSQRGAERRLRPRAVRARRPLRCPAGLDRDAAPLLGGADGRPWRTSTSACSSAQGELLRTEISAKFTPAQIERELGDAGMRTEARWTDRAGDFAVTLAVGAERPRRASAAAGLACPAADALDGIQRRDRGAPERGAEQRVRPERGGGEEHFLVRATVDGLGDHQPDSDEAGLVDGPGTVARASDGGPR